MQKNQKLKNLQNQKKPPNLIPTPEEMEQSRAYVAGIFRERSHTNYMTTSKTTIKHPQLTD